MRGTRRVGARAKLLAAGVVALTLAIAAGACGGSDEDDAQPATESPAVETAAAPEGEPIIVGATLPLTGALAPFGALIQPGYEQAVSEVNAAGGLDVGGERRPVELKILDNKSDPNLATEQAQTLYLQDGAVALLGAVTPPLTIPISAVAEQVGRPLVSGLTPIRAWLGAAPEGGWKYAWDFFFDENEFTDQQFQVADLVETNKKVALFTDTEEDGIVMGELWTQKAPAFGYEIVSHATFPVGTTDYQQFIDEAMSKDADILIAIMIPPDAVALWKQMKASGWVPELAFCEKCGNNGAWGQTLGDLSVGTSTVGYWSKHLGNPNTEEFVQQYEGELGDNEDISTLVSAYSGALLLFDAIEAAGSTDPDAINNAIAETDKLYPLAHIRFEADHSSAIPVLHKQWRTPTTAVVIFPADTPGAEPPETPVPGLQ